MKLITNKERFLEDMLLFKQELINSLKIISVEEYRQDYIGRYSPERFKEFFIEKTAVHNLFKYILIRIIEDSMKSVNVKLNTEGLKKWKEMSKNFRTDYDFLLELAIVDIKRESNELNMIFQKTIFDSKVFQNSMKSSFMRFIPILAKYEFDTLDAELTLTTIDNIYSLENRREINSFIETSPIIEFLLHQVGLE